jgi:hypothetical protein
VAARASQAAAQQALAAADRPRSGSRRKLCPLQVPQEVSTARTGWEPAPVVRASAAPVPRVGAVQPPISGWSIRDFDISRSVIWPTSSQLRPLKMNKRAEDRLSGRLQECVLQCFLLIRIMLFATLRLMQSQQTGIKQHGKSKIV